MSTPFGSTPLFERNDARAAIGPPHVPRHEQADRGDGSGSGVAWWSAQVVFPAASMAFSTGFGRCA